MVCFFKSSSLPPSMTKLSVLFVPFLFVSCATITRGPHDKLYVKSEPSGAEAQLSTGERSLTPAKFVKSRRESFTVTVSKPGYVAQTVKIESKMSATGGTAMVGNVIAGAGVLSVIGIGVDASTGAMLSLYPNPVVVRLIPMRTGKPAKRSTTSSTPKTENKEGSREPNTIAKPQSSPPTENLPPIVSTPAPESSPVLQSVPENSPVPQSSPSP
jgi:hypothetical protein